MNQVLPNPLYYLDNFQSVLDWVSERYDDILIREERSFIADFAGLPETSRALFVRMVMRKGEYFRQSRLNYAELGDTEAALLPLLKAGWVGSDPLLTLEQLFDLLQKPEIARVFSLTPAQKQLRKAEQLDCLHSEHAEPRAYSVWDPESTDAVVQIRHKALCERLRLIFFGNWHQDWSEFVLSDLGIYRYESIPFSVESRGFRTRRDVDDYIALQVCRDLFHNQEPLAVVLEALELVPRSDNDWISRRRDRLLFQLGQQAEKLKDWDQALAIYAMSHYPGTRLRTVRVLEKSGQSGAALQLLNAALAAPESEAEVQQLLRSAPRLKRQLGYQKTVALAPARVETITLRLPYPSPAAAPFTVEGVVRDHLSQHDAPVYYVENTLINSLFGLLCWPAIFKPVPGAFFHPFQRGPVDLTSPDFHARRQDDFAACLALLDSEAYIATICETWRIKQGIQSPFVFWEVLDEELLGLALTCIPAQHLRHWFVRILSDIKTNRNGFPDLIQFWPNEQRYHMIEVKGPGDRLQDNQQRLIEYCALHQMPISVCYLDWLLESP